MKHILVVDVNMTKDNKHICEDDKQRCPLWNTDTKFCMYNFNNNTKDCPLKPLPKRKFEMRILKKDHYEESKYIKGYNDCIDDILGGNEQ